MADDDLLACDLIQSAYNHELSGWDWVHDVDGQRCFLKQIDDTSHVIFPGTETPHEWYLDAISERSMMVSGVGSAPVGFYFGVAQIHDALEPQLQSKVSISGHSLGAARAPEFAAWLKATGFHGSVDWCAIACPRCGDDALVANAGPGRWYRNNTDPVTFVPWDLKVRHAGSRVQLNVAAGPDDPWGPLRDHHLALYRQGIAALPQG